MRAPNRSKITPSRLNAPLLRWAGSKRKLIPQILEFAPPAYERYVEPFAGSACIFFALEPKKALLSDFNEELIATYENIRAHPKLVYREAAAWENSSDRYYEIRAKIDVTDPVERAARFVYLNRYCFNGVYRTNKRGLFNVPRGSHTGELPSQKHFLRCSRILRASELRACDFAETLDDVGAGDFVYLDPPYARSKRAPSGEYGYGAFSEGDLDRLVRSINAIDSRGAVFVLSYTEGSILEEKLSQHFRLKLRVQRHVAGFSRFRKKVGEVILTNSPYRQCPQPL